MQLRLQAIIPETADIRSFIFVPETAITWQPGQSIRLELPVGYDLHERRFTIASAPEEGVIRITTRRGDSLFKKALWSLPLGTIVAAFSIEGTFVWRPATHTFLAAGMGITPFRAMLIHQSIPETTITLFHAAHEGEHLFSADFTALQATHSNFSYRQVSRHLTAEDLPTLEGLFYIAGPRKMVQELATALQAQVINERAIIRDIFTGY